MLSGSFIKKIEEVYKSEEPRKILKQWNYKFLYGKDLWDFCRHVKDAVTLCGVQKLTNSVMTAILHMNRASSKSG